MSWETGNPVPESAVYEITKEGIRAYADVSGDHNKIHLDDKVAQSRGLPGVIAHGMLVKSYVGSRLVELMQAELAAGWQVVRFHTRFKSMTLPGNQIKVTGIVKSTTAGNIELALRAVDQHGDVKTISHVSLIKG